MRGSILLDSFSNGKGVPFEVLIANALLDYFRVDKLVLRTRKGIVVVTRK